MAKRPPSKSRWTGKAAASPKADPWRFENLPPAMQLELRARLEKADLDIGLIDFDEGMRVADRVISRLTE